MTRIKKWFRLLLAVLVVAVCVLLLRHFSPTLPGPLGRIYRHTAARDDIDATALFYTEVRHVRDFIDEKNGRYRTSDLSDF